MTVGQLREALASFSASTPIIVAEDPEGNGYYHVHEVDSGYTNPEEYRPELLEDVTEGTNEGPCAVIWPG